MHSRTHVFVEHMCIVGQRRTARVCVCVQHALTINWVRSYKMDA